jgi:hypothetical protein
MGKYVFGQEETNETNEGLNLDKIKESLSEPGFAMEPEISKSNKPKYSMKEAKLGKKPMKKKIREFNSDSTKEYDQAIRFLIKDLVKNHGISRGASLERILSMFQSFYNKAIEYGDSAGSKKVNRIVGKYL